MMSKLQFSVAESVKVNPCGTEEKQLSARHWRAALHLSLWIQVLVHPHTILVHSFYNLITLDWIIITLKFILKSMAEYDKSAADILFRIHKTWSMFLKFEILTKRIIYFWSFYMSVNIYFCLYECFFRCKIGCLTVYESKPHCLGLQYKQKMFSNN